MRKNDFSHTMVLKIPAQKGLKQKDNQHLKTPKTDLWSQQRDKTDFISIELIQNLQLNNEKMDELENRIV